MGTIQEGRPYGPLCSLGRTQKAGVHLTGGRTPALCAVRGAVQVAITLQAVAATWGLAALGSSRWGKTQ